MLHCANTRAPATSDFCRSGFLHRGYLLCFRAVAQVTVKPVYVLHGGDAFLCDAHRREIVSQVIGDADPQVSVASFDATAELADVLDELRTMPFLSPRRVVIVRDADPFISAHRESLEKYLNSPSANSVLILIVASWPSTTRLYKLVAKIGEVRNCAAVEGANLAKWLAEATARRGKKLDANAAELLARWMGNDLAALDQEIEKLSLYVDGRGTIKLSDISAVVTATAGPVAFGLTNAITNADTPGALEALAKMLTRRGNEFAALGSIAWHLRRAMSAQEVIRSGAAPANAIPRMPYPQQNAFLAMLKRRPLEALRKDFRRLIQADLAMKSGGAAVGVMQTLVVQLCS